MKSSIKRSKLFLLFVVLAFVLSFIGNTATAAPIKVNMRTPSVKMEGDPSKSFWKNQVTYQFDVKYAKAKDTRGEEWEIGYMDEYFGKEKNPKVFVILHGKGGSGGHYSYLMKVALENGFRVIVPDMLHYGFSSPGNVDKSPARTFKDIRVTLYELIHKQLKVKKAYYHGHSLGGQIAIGMALDYPNNVAGLVLEAPAGLEEMPGELDMGEDGKLPWLDPSYAYDYDKWKEIWDKLGQLKKEFSKTEEDIRLFYYFKKKNPETGAIETIPTGYFHRETPDTRYITDQRVAIITANKKEYEQHIIAFIRDIYSMGIELRIEDPGSFHKRLVEIKSPIFLAVGQDEPFVPTKWLGHNDMRADILQPMYERLTAAGCKPIFKIYTKEGQKVGHFIHTDAQEEYAQDVVDFMTKGKIKKDTPFKAASKKAAASGAGETKKEPVFAK